MSEANESMYFHFFCFHEKASVFLNTNRCIFQCLTIEPQLKTSRHCSGSTGSWKNIPRIQEPPTYKYKKTVLQPHQSTLCVGSISMNLNLFFSRIHSWGGFSSTPSQHVCISGISFFQVFILLMVSLVGLSWGLHLVFRELRRKNVIKCLTPKYSNNILSFCAWASSVNAYGKLCLRGFLMPY